MTTPNVYVSPIGSWARPERIDMGVDYGGSGPLYAVGSGKITNVYNSGWPGGTFITLLLDSGPQAGKYVYYAEDIAPKVSVGQQVKAGQVIGNATGGSSGVELGWAAPPGSGQTMAAATNEIPGSGDPGSWSTAYGVSFSNFIASLGGKPGIIQSGHPISGQVGAGYPGGSGATTDAATTTSALGSGCVPLIWVVYYAVRYTAQFGRNLSRRQRRNRRRKDEKRNQSRSQETDETSLRHRTRVAPYRRQTLK